MSALQQMAMPNGGLSAVLQVFRRSPREASHLESELARKHQYLSKIDIFRDLSPQEIHILEDMTIMTTVGRGRVIYRQEDHAEGLFLLKKGRVRLSRFSPNGKKLDVAVLGPGTFFGEMPLLGETMRNTEAEAMDDCTLCVMSEADIERMVLDKPQVAIRMVATLGRRLANAEARLEDMAYQQVPARLASLLLRLAQEGGDVVEGYSHQDLGDSVGAYRETITKVLDDFQARGMVELARRRIRLLDRAGLTAILEES